MYLKLNGRRGGEFLIVEKQGLLISGSLPLHSRDAASTVVFSDGDYLGTISPIKDVSILFLLTVDNCLMCEFN